MNILLIGAIVFVAFAVIYKFFFKKKNSVVYTEIYELNGNRLTRLNPKFPDKAKITEVNGVHELFLPKKYYSGTPFGLPVPEPQEYISNHMGVKLLKIAKVSENEFRSMNHDFEVSDEEIKSKYKVVDKDIAFWMKNQNERIDMDYKVESKWDKIKPLLTIGVVAVICLMMIYVTLEKAGEIMDSASGERKETTNLIQKFIDNPSGVANFINNDNREGIDTNATKPPLQK